MTDPQTTTLPAVLIDPGQKAPDFTLPDQDQRTHHLKDYRGQWVILYFYPKDNTSGCTKQACQFRDQTALFTDANAVVLGVSPDPVQSHIKFRSKHDLPFDLLADTDKHTCQAYGVWQQKSMYGKKYMGVVRTTYLISPKGKIVYRWDKVKVTGHDQDVAAKLEEASI